MSTVDDDQPVAPEDEGTPQEHDAEAMPADGLLAPPADDVPVVSGPACRVCGAGLEAGQAWCLECGTATAPPRRLPGLRAVGLAGLLTLLLAGGAVAASYAALTDEAPKQETKIQTVAAAAPEAPVDTTATDDATATDDTAATDTTFDDTATDDTTFDDTSTDDFSTDTTFDDTSTDDTSVDDTTTTDDTTTDTTTTDTTTTDTTTTPAEAAKPSGKEIVLAAGAGGLYDPLARATAAGDPERAIDGNPKRAWFANTPADGQPMDLGYVVNIGTKSAISDIEIQTKTPGFTVQVFGAAGSDPPATILDSSWHLLAQAGSVDVAPPAGAPPAIAPAPGDVAGDGNVVLKVDDKAAADRYQQVLVWYTVPPTTPPGTSPIVRLNELGLFAPKA